MEATLGVCWKVGWDTADMTGSRKTNSPIHTDRNLPIPRIDIISSHLFKERRKIIHLLLSGISERRINRIPPGGSRHNNLVQELNWKTGNGIRRYYSIHWCNHYSVDTSPFDEEGTHQIALRCVSLACGWKCGPRILSLWSPVLSFFSPLPGLRKTWSPTPPPLISGVLILTSRKRTFQQRKSYKSIKNIKYQEIMQLQSCKKN